MFKWSYNEIWMFLRDNFFVSEWKEVKMLQKNFEKFFCEFSESFEKFERLRDEFVKETQRRSFVWLFFVFNFFFEFILICVFVCVFLFLFSFQFLFWFFVFFNLTKHFLGNFPEIWDEFNVIFLFLFFSMKIFWKCVEVCRME